MEIMHRCSTAILASSLMFGSSTDATITHWHIDSRSPHLPARGPGHKADIHMHTLPPGSHMSKHCTATEDTTCSPCPDSEDHFTQFWNYLPKLLYCKFASVKKAIFGKPTSASSTRSVHMDTEWDFRHFWGIIGTLHSDTKYERCARGTFSAVTSSTSPCVKHTECKSMDLHAVLRGTSWHDNIYSTCENLQNSVLIGHRFRVIHNSYVITFLADLPLNVFALWYSDLCNGNIPSIQTNHLHLPISEWIGGASIDQLKKLPMQLRHSNIHNTAVNFSNIFKELGISTSNCE
uniref:Death domain-containing protein n=1 Tax=Sinocyclocheilus anshuiensis TaxID=1608454 RepID=A0A671S977_9TELE